jgi:heat shock 70kDa protein 1/2/6/8
LIGDAAKNQAAMNPSNTVFGAKRLIGRKMDDPAIQQDLKHWPFKVIGKDDNKPHIKGRICVSAIAYLKVNRHATGG